jgi:NAD(P)-dependent dehydrogenase (short-subunit alcohol dehydrogenase family)
LLVGRREGVLQEACRALGGTAAYVVYDVRDCEAAAGFAARVQQEHGPVVNNAGVHLKKPTIQTTEQEFAEVLQTHVLGAFSMVRHFAGPMLERRHGSILFMASMTSLIGMPLVPAYSAAKSAYLGLVRSLATEFGTGGVRGNAIAPGWIETPMLEQALSHDQERRRRILARTPLGRFGEPRDVALAALYLCSPAAKFISGILLPVDGGASIGF